MSKTISAKYLKKDIYGNLCFITNETIDKKTCDELTKIEKKLGEIVPDTYLPVYTTKNNVISVRCEKSDLPPFKKNCVYELIVEIKTRAKQDKSRYAVITILKKKFIKDCNEEEVIDL